MSAGVCAGRLARVWGLVGVMLGVVGIGCGGSVCACSKHIVELACGSVCACRSCVC